MNIKKSDRSSILIMMVRSQRTLEIKAGIFDASLERFTDVRIILKFNLATN